MTDRRRAFSFRQRVGKLNWKRISGVNLEVVIDDLDLDELQAVLDNVTFSEVRPSDIRSSSVESTTKLICVMQLMLEHLLYCQESQYQLIKQLYKQIGDQSKEISDLTKKNVAYRESIKIYQRQIAMLQKSKQNEDDNNDRVKIIQAPTPQPPQTKTTPTVDYIQPVLESVLNHERKTREYLRDVLQEQRDLYLQELQRISPRDNSNDILTLKYDINDRFSEMLEKIQSMQILPVPPDTSQQDRLNRLEEDFKHRELQLREREQRIVYREEDIERRLRDLAKTPRTSVQVPVQSKDMVTRDIYKQAVKELEDAQQRERELQAKYNEMCEKNKCESRRYEEVLEQLEAARLRELELQKKYDNEREKNVIEKARYNTLSKQKAIAVAAARFILSTLFYMK